MKRARLRPILVLMAVLSVAAISAPPVDAADDGGTRSVFAYGAGNRALALGGAFVAVADDASAAIWNPGGLGIVPRREFQASWSKLYGLDMTESYFALALPSWRLGTAAASVRSFGVGGIEGRDARNSVYDDDLTSSDTEISIGYGRTLTDGLSAGAAFKFRQQSLAGFSASGMGADVGLLLRPDAVLGIQQDWMRGMTIGVALRNVVEPTLRLDKDNVADPMSLRLGAAYGRSFLSGGSLLASVELERTAEMTPRAHAGLELRFHPLVTLRGGFDDGQPTAGAGIQWHGVLLDYLFADNELGTVHRLGVSLRLGATTEERRVAARLAEEQRLASRLAQAYEKRQAERAEELFGAAAVAHREGRHDDALEQLGLVEALTPGRADVTEMETDCWRRKAAELETTGDFAEAALAYTRALGFSPHDSLATQGAERCRRESDRKAARSELLKREFAGALDAFSAGDLPAARDRLTKLLKLEPGDQEAASMLDRTRKAIGKRTDELLDQADRLAKRGRYDDASGLLAEARALNPSAKGLEVAERNLAGARSGSLSPPKDAGSSGHSPVLNQWALGEANPAARQAAITPQQKREIEDLYRRGIESMKAERTQDALRYWELVFSIDPEYLQVREYLKREYLMGGMDSFAAGRLEDAVTYWEKALRLDPTDEKAIGYLAGARQQLSRTREILEGKN
jgi:tetratricopeptide (TPR) repeat protein